MSFKGSIIIIMSAPDDYQTIFQLPGSAATKDQSVCILNDNDTSCCSYNMTCSGQNPCQISCNGQWCGNECCDTAVGKCTNVSGIHYCLPHGFSICGNNLCGQQCNPETETCPQYTCCSSFPNQICCPSTTPVCCSDYCCPSGYQCCGANQCCESPSSWCGDHCCASGSECCNNRCCPSGYSCVGNNACQEIGSTPCSDDHHQWCCKNNHYCCGGNQETYGCCPHGSTYCTSGYCHKPDPGTYCADGGGCCCQTGKCCCCGWYCGAVGNCLAGFDEDDSVPHIRVHPKEPFKNKYLQRNEFLQKLSKPEEKLDVAYTIPDPTNQDWQTKITINCNTESATSNCQMIQGTFSESRNKQLLPNMRKYTRTGSFQTNPYTCCLKNEETIDVCSVGFDCFINVTNCHGQDSTDYLNYFGKTLLCDNVEDLLQDGKVWWNCTQKCVTNATRNTMLGNFIPCCNQLDEYGFNVTNVECMMNTCHFCNISRDNWTPLGRHFGKSKGNIWAVQLQDFMNTCKNLVV